MTDLLVTNGTSFNLLTGTNLSATASLENLTLPLTGVQQVVANYQGNSFFDPSTSNTVTLPVPLVPTVQLTNDGESFITPAYTVNITVTVTNANGVTPTGTVQFYDNGNALGSPVTLTKGSAIFSTTAFVAGTHTITASYSGDANYQPTTSNSLSIEVQQLDTLTSLYNGPLTLLSGSPVNLPFQLSTNISGFPAPTGSISVELYPSNSSPATLVSAPLSGNPPFIVNIPVNTANQPLPVGQQVVGGQYSGDQNWEGSID